MGVTLALGLCYKAVICYERFLYMTLLLLYYRLYYLGFIFKSYTNRECDFFVLSVTKALLNMKLYSWGILSIAH